MSFQPGYRVVGNNSFHVAVVTDAGTELAVTQSTPDREMAERWCRDLKRAAQVEDDRRKAARRA